MSDASFMREGNKMDYDYNWESETEEEHLRELSKSIKNLSIFYVKCDRCGNHVLLFRQFMMPNLFCSIYYASQHGFKPVNVCKKCHDEGFRPTQVYMNTITWKNIKSDKA